jgi:hypothetical protein
VTPSISPVTPHYRVAPDAFHNLIEVWREAFDEEHRIIMPGSMAEAVHEANKRYPRKRLIVHFLRPHIPFMDSPELVFQGWWSPGRIIRK